jgi:nucleotide-binding universal stress UspA family protein
MFQRLLICTDLTDGLQRLVDFIPSLAVSGIKKVVFLHVLPLDSDREIPRIDEEEAKPARDQLSVAKQQAPAGVEVEIEIQWGRPLDRILSTAEAHQVDLIMLGTPSRSMLTEKLFGSTTMGLCQRTPTPVMIFRPQLLSTYTVEELDLRCRHLFRYFLIPYDGSKPAHYLIEQIKTWAKNRPANSLEECLLCWVIEEGGRRGIPGIQPDEAAAQLEAVKSELETLTLQVTTQVIQGEPVPEILLAAQVYDISAIVSSSDSLGTLLEWSIPSFSGEILRRSWHPVIYFPPSKD